MSTHAARWILALLTISACPAAAVAQTIETLELAPGFTPDPVTRTGMAGGSLGAETLGFGPMGACVGWVATQPNFEMELAEPFDFLELAVTSDSDTTLVIEGPVGFWCNDDSSGLNPAMFGRWAAGHYRVWVGTYQAGQTPAYSIRITEQRDLAAALLPPAGSPAAAGAVVGGAVATPVVPSAAGSAAGLNLTGATASFGTVAIVPGSRHFQTMPGTSGGGQQADSLGNTAMGPCRGWIASEPDHIVTLNGPFPFLRLEVASAGDTTLVVQGPSGWLCNDDSVGLNPRLAGAFPAGTYRVWVGSYESAQNHPYSLTVSESW